jgi:hypothetical protein
MAPIRMWRTILWATHTAILRDQPAMIRTLLEAGVDPNGRMTQTRRSDPLEGAPYTLPHFLAGLSWPLIFTVVGGLLLILGA